MTPAELAAMRHSVNVLAEIARKQIAQGYDLPSLPEQVLIFASEGASDARLSGDQDRRQTH